MDFNTFNEVSSIDIHPQSSKIEKSIFTPYFTLFGLLTNIFAFMKVLYELNYCWVLNVKRCFCNKIVRVRSGKLHKWFRNNCKKVNNLFKSPYAQIPLAVCNTKNKKINEELDKSRDSDLNELQSIHYNTKSSVNNCTNNKCNLFAKNELHTSFDDLSNLTKIIHKKLIQNDVNLRYELLEAEKKLCTKIKQINDLERTLCNVKENAARHRYNFQNEIFNKSSSSLRRRTSFFGNTFNCSNKKSNNLTNERAVTADAQELQWTALQEQINRLKNMHFNEVISLHSQISKQEEIINKLEKSNVTFVELCQEVQKDITRMKHEGLHTSIKLQKLTLMKEHHEQESSRLDRLNRELLSELLDSSEQVKRLSLALDEADRDRQPRRLEAGRRRGAREAY